MKIGQREKCTRRLLRRGGAERKSAAGHLRKISSMSGAKYPRSTADRSDKAIARYQSRKDPSRGLGLRKGQTKSADIDLKKR